MRNCWLEKRDRRDSLLFKYHKGDESGFDYYMIQKGSYATKVYADMYGLKDCCGLCATLEMANVIKQELELGREGLDQLYSAGFAFTDEDNRNREELIKSLKRVELSDHEFKLLVIFVNGLRGNHKCVMTGYSNA